MSSSSRCASRPERRRWLLAAAALPWAALAQPSWPELPADWQQRGQGRLRFLGLAVYEIGLWAPAAVNAERWSEQALALAIRYQRALKGRLIAERSLKEMRRQGTIDEAKAARWLATMTATFPDVADGDRLTGLHEPDRGARFFLNGQPRGERFDAELSRWFFGIWLAPQSSEPALRASLLGLPP